jgi:hypothetical protein
MLHNMALHCILWSFSKKQEFKRGESADGCGGGGGGSGERM